MRFTHLRLENWRNFRSVDVSLQQRVFLVGPNASGKSNFLDAFRFLRDVADPQGGLQRAVSKVRGSISQIRSLHARRYPNVAIEVEVGNGGGDAWSYRLELTQSNQRVPMVAREIVKRGDSIVLQRPDADDRADSSRQTQTHLEQVNANKGFRELADFFAQVRYLHLVPQLVREPDRSKGLSKDPFGGDFLEQLARTPKKTLTSRLVRIQAALKVAVPQLKEMRLERDAVGVPHLKALYDHWRPNAGWQNEDQLSDGTLRLLGLLWVFLDGSAPLLLEEPELSLHSAVVRHIPQIIQRLGRKSGRQTIVSTHSADLLADSGIGADEILILNPETEGTSVTVAVKNKQVRALLEGGHMSIADAVIPQSAPKLATQLVLFGE
ncbi:MAG TPA: AAA family ATPase [Vicinamibacteria bacterium]|nr:AAA family ATPase [Vicinamibacteria bacterium]